MVTPQILLLSTVVAVGVLHTIVPDHWVPITLLARQRGWSRAHTARTAFVAGVGHVTSTLIIALVVWIAGVAVATRFGHLVDILSSLALIAFGGWIAISSWLEVYGHSHEQRHHHNDSREGTHGHHEHNDSKKSQRTGLLLILGASPMLEGIPAFFAASKYGVGLIIAMSLLFALSTIATYVVLCVYSTEGLRHVEFPAFELYGEVLSGAFIAFVGIVFFLFPVL